MAPWLWQNYDLYPDFPELQGFLEFWQKISRRCPAFGHGCAFPPHQTGRDQNSGWHFEASLISDRFHALGRGRVLVSRFGRLFGKLLAEYRDPTRPRTSPTVTRTTPHAIFRLRAPRHGSTCISKQSGSNNCASALGRFGSYSSVCTAVGPFAQLVRVASITCTRRFQQQNRPILPTGSAFWNWQRLDENPSETLVRRLERTHLR